MSDQNQLEKLDRLREDRLDRIEQKIDNLSNVLVSMAKVEEKLAQIEIQRIELRKRIDSLSNELHEVKDVANKNQVTVNLINKVAWAVIAAIIGLSGTLISYFLGK